MKPTHAWICDGIRTPFGRFGGGLSAIRTDDLAALAIQSLLARHPGLDLAAIDEVQLGCANQAGEDNRNVARMAALLAGLPPSVPGVTLNRLCASGLEAVGQAARACALGEAELVIAGGIESMSRAPYVLGKADAAHSREQKLEDTTLGWRFVNPRMRQLYGVDAMAQTAENLAREHGISREDQDSYALRSQQRAGRAIAEGFFAGELTEVRTGPDTAVPADEQPRPNTTLARLASLAPLLGEGTSITAGNASGINDGACALLVASESAARRSALTPRGGNRHHTGAELHLAAALVHRDHEAGHGAHREEGDHAARNEQRDERHAQQAGLQALHQQRVVVALPGGEQEGKVARAEAQQQKRHRVIPLVA